MRVAKTTNNDTDTNFVNYKSNNINCETYEIFRQSFLTNLLLTYPVWGASLMYSSIVARKEGGGCSSYIVKKIVTFFLT